MFNLRLIILLLWLGLTFPILGDNSYADAFLNIGTSARDIGLGQAVVALPQHPSGYLINPSASGYVKSASITGLFINQFGMADYFSLGFSVPKGENYQWGVHTVNLFIDNILERPDLRKITDLEVRRDSIRTLVAQGFNSFKDWEGAYVINVSRNFSTTVDLGWQFTAFPVKIPVGLNIKLLRKSLATNQAWGIGLDLGLMIITNLNRIFVYNWLGDMIFGLALNNIAGTRLYWNTDKQDLIPMQLISGLSYRQDFNRWPLACTIFAQKNSIYEKELQLGFETVYKNKLSVRIGSTTGYLQGGLGFRFLRSGKMLDIDYSFSNHDLGNAHRIGGSLEW